MTTPDVTYRVFAQQGDKRIPIAGGFTTREEAEQFLDDYCRFIDTDSVHWHMCVGEETSQKQKYYEFIDRLLDNARRELSDQDMMELINDLGVVLDMHFDGIRREVEGEYDEE